MLTLLGHCHGDFAAFWSKLLKYFRKNLFFNMKLLLQHREENINVFLLRRTNQNQFVATSLKYTGRTWKNWPTFQVKIHFHPSHPQPNIINSSFCALVGLLLTKLKHYFNYSIEINTLNRWQCLSNITSSWSRERIKRVSYSTCTTVKKECEKQW